MLLFSIHHCLVQAGISLVGHRAQGTRAALDLLCDSRRASPERFSYIFCIRQWFSSKGWQQVLHFTDGETEGKNQGQGAGHSTESRADLVPWAPLFDIVARTGSICAGCCQEKCQQLSQLGCLFGSTCNFHPLLQPSASADGDFWLPPTAHLLWDVDL